VEKSKNVILITTIRIVLGKVLLVFLFNFWKYMRVFVQKQSSQFYKQRENKLFWVTFLADDVTDVTRKLAQ